MIVDFIGVFQDLQNALGIYGGDTRENDTPIEDKAALVEELKTTVEAMNKLCEGRNVTLQSVLQGEGATRLEAMQKCLWALIYPAEIKERFTELAGKVAKLFSAIGFDPRRDPYVKDWLAAGVLYQAIKNLKQPGDLRAVLEQIEALLDRKVGTTGTMYQILDADGLPAPIAVADVARAASEYAKPATKF